MKRCMSWIAVLVISWSATLSHGQTPAAVGSVAPALVTNGCGSGRLGVLVPNKTWLPKCEFEASCNAHDLCYSKCLAGGALEGSPSCDVKADKQRRRASCDVSLQKDIVVSNPGNRGCSMFASIYRVAVQALGEAFFYGLTAGASVEEPLARFADYIQKHPQEFDIAEVEKAFDAVATAGLQGHDYYVMFQPGEPRLRMFHDGKIIIDLSGKSSEK